VEDQWSCISIFIKNWPESIAFMLNISFHQTEGVKNPLNNPKKKYVSWLEKIISDHSKSVHYINYIFCDDTYLLEINRQYLNHDDYTDIITFPYHLADRPIESDIFISTERVKENAESFGTSFDDELLRVMAHGLLHLLGYGDKDDISKAAMRKAEDYSINQFFSDLK
jgi:probable rRNA maturation factor